MIFQNPQESLNPRMTVAKLWRKRLHFHFPATTASECEVKMLGVLADTGLSADTFVALSRTNSPAGKTKNQHRPRLNRPTQCIIADEPIAALDVSVQAQILNLLSDCATNTNWLTFHYPRFVRGGTFRPPSHRHVFGLICETGSSKTLFKKPRHPTRKPFCKRRRVSANRWPPPNYPENRRHRWLFLQGALFIPVVRMPISVAAMINKIDAASRRHRRLPCGGRRTNSSGVKSKQ